MSNYNFVEIGTSYFKTLIQLASDSHIGLSIEPIQSYLDMLPTKAKVHKLCGAVISSEEDRDLNFYYVEPEVIDKLNLGVWLKGCNSLGKPHDFHTHYCEQSMWPELIKAKDKSVVNTKNLLEMGIVKVIKVPTFTFEELVNIYRIDGVELLKIDTEGMDCKIINSILSSYEDNKINFKPLVIKFESNWHTDQKEVEETIDRLVAFGYHLESRGDDTTVRLK